MPAPSCTLYLPPDPAAAGGAGGAGGTELHAATALRAATPLPDLAALPTWQVLDLVEAGRQLGLVRVSLHGKAGAGEGAEAAAGAGKPEDGRAAGSNAVPSAAAGAVGGGSVSSVPGDSRGMVAGAAAASQEAGGAVWSYAGCEAAGELELVGKLVATGLAAGLANEVDAMLHGLRVGAD